MAKAWSVNNRGCGPARNSSYTSGVMLATEHGTMQGHYDMQADDGTEFAAPVAPFVLAIPRTLH